MCKASRAIFIFMTKKSFKFIGPVEKSFGMNFNKLKEFIVSLLFYDLQSLIKLRST